MKKFILAFIAIVLTTMAFGQQSPHWVEIPNPFPGIKFFNNKICREIKPTFASGAYSNNSKKMNLLFVFDFFIRDEDLQQKGLSDDERLSKIVTRVYLLKDGETRDSSLKEPTFITELVYHNLGDNAFLGIKTEEPLYDKDLHYGGAMFQEYRLDDESAQYLLDFSTNDTKWLNGTDIKFSITNSPDLLPILSTKDEAARGIYF